MTADEKLQQISYEIEHFIGMLETIGQLDVEDLELLTSEQKKLTKKERRKFAEDALKAKLPHVFEQLEEFSLVIEGLSNKVERMKTELQEKLDDVEDIENEKEELQSRIDDLQ